MEFYTWREELDVDVKAIDEQHKELVRMINELYSAMILRNGPAKHGEIVDRMVRYANSHFAVEERYMSRFGYPGYLAHKAEHEKFLAKAKDLHDRVNGGRMVLSLEMVTFLRDWLNQHIQGTDRKYIPCFHSNGLR